MRLLVPSKTFLIGEYLATQGGLAIVIAHPPYFRLTLRRRSTVEHSPYFAPSTPAGRYWQDYGKSDYQLVLDDPHQGRGGFGASSAAFIAAYSAANALRTGRPIHFANSQERHAMWRAYQDYQTPHSGLNPSGYDVLAQLTAGLIAIEQTTHHFAHYPWPFTELMLRICRTANKTITHQHLRGITSLPLDNLKRQSSAALQALQQRCGVALARALTGYQEVLTGAGLCHPATQRLLASLSAQPECLAAKGCGAAGTDSFCTLEDRRRPIPRLPENTQQIFRVSA